MKNRGLLVVAVLMVVTLVISGCMDTSEPFKETEVTKDNVVSLIDSLKIQLYERDLIEGEVPEREIQDNSNKQSAFMYELPDIENYEPIVSGSSANNVEIFLPLENSGGNIESVVVKAAELYNSSHENSSISIRTLENTLAEDFIQSGAYMPDGYISSNVLYGFTLKENGISASQVTDRLLGNTVGIAIKKEAYEKLKSKYTDVDYDEVFKASFDKDIKIGYLNPINNPTGLNFVVSMLSYFDSSNPFSMEATTDFSSFQNNAKVFYSMSQMKEAINRGLIDAYTVEYQAYVANEATADFVFIPFGVRQDYPLLAVGDLSEDKMTILKDFSQLFESPEISEYASSIGFNKNDDYQSTVNAQYYDGIMNEILSFWKEDRSTTKKIAVYFVCDISGSMEGKKLEALKESALNAMQYIGENNLVGLMGFNSKVYNSVPIAEFTETQQKYFAGAVRSWRANDGTATNNAILMALKELDSVKKQYGEIETLIILLSDGYTESGYSLKSVSKLMEAFDTPIYTIGYEADIKELEAIAAINNGIFINASTDDVGYILKNLFNAEM